MTHKNTNPVMGEVEAYGYYHGGRFPMQIGKTPGLSEPKSEVGFVQLT
jgi:hypothetical protein